MANVPVEPHHSADRAWWFDGSQWFAASSPDRRWWFDGTSWRPASRLAPLVRGRADVIVLAAWMTIAITAAALSVYTSQSTRPEHERGGVLALGIMGVIAAFTLPVSGYVAASAPRAGARLGGLVAYAWVMTMGIYGLAMLTSAPSGGPDTDTGAGAGLVILAVPVAFVIATLTLLGAAVRRARLWVKSWYRT